MRGVLGQIRPLYFWIAAAVIIIILFLFGSVLSAQAFEVAGCRAEWSTVPQTVQSDLCPDPGEPCTAEPFIQQHNAQVEALLCACNRAADGGTYPDAQLNEEIEQAFARVSGLPLPIRDICEGGGGGFMATWRYT